MQRLNRENPIYKPIDRVSFEFYDVLKPFSSMSEESSQVALTKYNQSIISASTKHLTFNITNCQTNSISTNITISIIQRPSPLEKINMTKQPIIYLRRDIKVWKTVNNSIRRVRLGIVLCRDSRGHVLGSHFVFEYHGSLDSFIWLFWVTCLDNLSWELKDILGKYKS